MNAKVRRYAWTLGVAVAAAVALWGATVHWIRQTRRARADLIATLAAVQHADRPTLAQIWGDRLHWTPDAAAPVALAVMPREKRLRFDAIYACYVGEHVAATLALTTLGGYVNGLPINNRLYGPRLVERPLTESERAGLEQLITLLEIRLRELDPQSNLHGWTRHVLMIARHLDDFRQPPIFMDKPR